MLKPETEIQRIYWKIGDLAKELGVEPSCIRFWMDTFNFEVKRNARGERKFTARECTLIREIHRLVKIELYTLEGAKRQLELKGAIREFLGYPQRANVTRNI